MSVAAFSIERGLLNERARFYLVDLPESRGRKFADYGLITGARYFLLGVVAQSQRACESYAYLLEHLVLKATDLGLSTCWVGYFHPEYFRDVRVAAGEIRPAVVVVGYDAEKRRLRDRLARAAVRASTRKEWPEIFFIESFGIPLTRQEAGRYASALEMVRLAPSSGNTQPWRIVKEANKPVFHFFMKEVKKAYARRHLHEVDIGIALAHFHLAAREAGLEGEWLISPPVVPDVPSAVHYRWTWKGE